MLIIQNDPAGITGRTRYALDCDATLQANIERHLQSGWGCTVAINGVEIDPLTDPRMDAPPTALDTVTVTRRPEGADPFTIALIVAAATVATMALMPKPDIGASITRNDSPNNRLTQQSNIARAYQGVPDVYGLRRVWPDLIQPSTVEYIDHIKYVTEWLCVSRGVGDVTSLKYADTTIDDIDGASYEIFSPSASGAGFHELRDTTISGVIETFASDEVNGQELTPYAPFATVSKSGTYSATAGATQFTVTMPDGSDLADLKSLIPTGAAFVTFARTGSLGAFGQTCTVLSWSIVGSNAVFVLSSSAWSADESGSTSFEITPDGGTTTALGPFTLPTTCSRLRWNTVFLRGLKGAVSIKATWWQIDSGGVEVSGTRQSQTDTYTADTYDQRYYTTNVTPSAGSGRYRIQFERTSAANGDGAADVAKLDELYAVRHYASKVLPGVTVIRITTKATEEATGFSDRKFNLIWQRHIRTLTGGESTIGASRNFGRIMSHMWRLSGGSAAELDTTALQAINTAIGETSPLLRFDGSLDDADMSLGERLQAVANAARCQLWRDGTRWTVTRDQARSYPEMQLDYRNLAASGESAISYSAHLPASHDGVEVEYVDEVTQAKKSYVRLSIATGSPVTGVSSNPLKIKLTGCATAAQAENRAQLEARRLIYSRTAVQDTAMADAGALGIGSLVRWVDPNDFAGDDGLQAGEVLSISGSTITTSEPLQWGNETSGRILFTAANGAQIGSPIVCYPESDGTVRLSSVPVELFVADGITSQLGSRYAFSVGLTQAEMEAVGLYTVLEIRPAADGAVSLSLAQYDSRIYEAD